MYYTNMHTHTHECQPLQSDRHSNRKYCKVLQELHFDSRTVLKESIKLYGVQAKKKGAFRFKPHIKRWLKYNHGLLL